MTIEKIYRVGVDVGELALPYKIRKLEDRLTNLLGGTNTDCVILRTATYYIS